jgi:hypothetical protein
MSGLFDNRSEKAQRREDRNKREQQAKMKTRRITIIVTVVFVLLVSTAAFINSRFVRRSPAAINIGGISFSAVEYDYYFSITYNNYTNEMISQFGDLAYAFGFLPIQGQPHAAQIRDIETGETWEDFFYSATIRELSNMVQIYNSAIADGFVLEYDIRQAIDEELEMFKEYARMSGTFESFYYENFGVLNMNESTLRRIMTFLMTVSSYRSHISDSFVFSETQKSDYYSENKDNFDNITFRIIYIEHEIDYSIEIETDEEYEEMNEAARAEAGERAAMIAESIDSEESFIVAAAEYDELLYADPDSTLIKDYPGGWLKTAAIEEVAQWLLDSARENGDCAAINTFDSTFVIFYIDRDTNQYRLTEMRQILVLREEVHYFMYTDGVDDPEYIEAFENADIKAREKAQEIVNLFEQGDATEEKLLELMSEYSDDSTEGGYYDSIPKGQMVSEIDSWLFSPVRRVGDYELIETEAYGYHFVYFMGHGERYSEYLAVEGIYDMNREYKVVSGLRENEFDAWRDTLEPVEVVRRWAFFFTQRI